METYTGKGVKLAVIDIGFEVNHPEFSKNITHTFNSKNLSLSVECTHSRYCYHGTATVGVIASNINQQGLRGLAPDVELILIQLDLSADYLSDDDILNALDYADKLGVDIINNSWGIEFVSPVIQEKIEKMSKEGRVEKE
jgi:major intracellular serine protease